MKLLNALLKFFGQFTSFFIADNEKASSNLNKPKKRIVKGAKREFPLTKDEDDSKSAIIEDFDERHVPSDHDIKLKNLQTELELLQISFAKEVKIEFKIKSEFAIKRISADLTFENHFQNLIPEYEEIDRINRSKRKEEIKNSKNLKEEILSFSLVELHIEREEKRKEAERLEMERKLDEEFSKLINSSHKELSNHEFKKAAEKLKEARVVRPEKAEELDKQLKNLSDKEKKYKKQKLEQIFRDLIKKSEIALENLEFNKGRLYLREAQTINPDMNSQIDLLIKNLNEAEIDYQRRKLEREYNDLKIESNEALGKKDFQSAVSILQNALRLRPEREDEIQKLLDNIEGEENDFKNRNREFKQLYNEAEDNFHSNNLEKAIILFENAIKLNIQSPLCKRRISDTRNKIQRIKRQEEERLEKARLEKLEKEQYKIDGDAIIAFYKANGIHQFYHYTDSRNLNSILQNNGLFSLNELQRRNISFLQGSETGEKPDFVRLSYTPEHPLKYVSVRNGRIRTPKNLEIELDVAKFKNTQFTNVNAARTSSDPTVTFGNDLNYLRGNVRFGVFNNMTYWSLNDNEKAYYQAEVMVKDQLELQYIINLKA